VSVRVHDIVIEYLADSEAELRERVCSLEQDVEAYRELLSAALRALVETTRENEVIDGRRATYQRHTGTWRETIQEREPEAAA
jgi:hypothetical protein